MGAVRAASSLCTLGTRQRFLQRGKGKKISIWKKRRNTRVLIYRKLACSWNLTHLNATMNIFDCTRHLKIGSNGLEIRNDHPHFESIRATASVNQGKWYYEALLLTTGIMQLGWATSRCRFSPEEGYGVGDDCVSKTMRLPRYFYRFD